MRRKASRVSSLILLAGILAVGCACTKPPNDSQLTAQIQSRFNEDSGLHAKPIAVQTVRGVVILSGTVENETERAAAERYASAIQGVQHVVNNLQIPATPAKATVDSIVSPAPEKSSAVTARATHRVAAGRLHTDPDSSESADDSLPSPLADNVMPDENPEPAASEPADAPAAPAPPPSPPSPPATKKVTVASGTSITIRLLDSLDSEKAQSGQTFRASLDAALPTDGDAVPMGYDVKGHVVDVKSAGKFSGQALIVLQLDSISIGSQSYGIDADPYRRKGANRTTNTAEKVGGGALLGAIIGGIGGGGKGAGIGAAAGGGIGGGVQAASKSQPIKLPAETVLHFTLKSPLTVTLSDQAPDSGRQKLEPPASQ
jgi:BON domain-containing protein